MKNIQTKQIYTKEYQQAKHILRKIGKAKNMTRNVQASGVAWFMLCTNRHC